MSAEYKFSPSQSAVFDEAVRKLFVRKRLEFGLSQNQLSQFLRVSPSTIRKWEDGTVCRCHDCHLAKVTGFLRGDFDSELSERLTTPAQLAVRFRDMPAQMRTFIRKAAMIHTLSEKRLDVRRHLQNGIRGIIQRYADQAFQKVR
ncbi:MAG: helix-turn-helix transcriptional regulator [Victivallales bacterium]|nr:helix-turn-helix transcriptional regulator [Victivallales bacterium]